MTFKVHQLTLGMVSTHCYILGDEETGNAIIIDPSGEAPKILSVIQDQHYSVSQILLTHAHFDHIFALREIKEALGAPFYMHELDVPLLQNLPNVAKRWLGEACPPAPPPDGFVNDGDVIQVGSIRLEVRFTPGHAPGHVAYISHEQHISFSGDSLFAGSVGRWDLPESNRETLFHSITTKLLTLPDDYQIAPGHMAYTTIGTERNTNPYLIEWLELNGH